MEIAFAIISATTLVSAIAAMSLRNPVHCALCLAVTLAGLAAFYLQLSAQFVGFAQILVYIGAVAILIVFAILLTRSESTPQPVISRSWVVGIFIAVVVFGVLARCVSTSPAIRHELPDKASPAVKEIGSQLMTRYVLPLEIIGLVLTAALIGAVIIALREPKKTLNAQPVNSPGPDSHPRAVSEQMISSP
jgi:NADH-quinone oxidoreductase subunit J